MRVGTELGDTDNKITWLVGGWSIASSVSFSMAGNLSDVFGRRWTIVSGQLFNIAGSVCLSLSLPPSLSLSLCPQAVGVEVERPSRFQFRRTRTRTCTCVRRLTSMPGCGGNGALGRTDHRGVDAPGLWMRHHLRQLCGHLGDAP